MTVSKIGWIYRDAFDAQYRRYRERTGDTNAQVAAKIGVAEGTLNGYRRRVMPWTPSQKVVLAAARLFACSPYEFMPELGNLMEQNLSPIDQYRINEVRKLLTDPELSDKEKDWIVDAARERWSLILQFNASMDR
jgi:transcriptional regulator with XRE-family HTH domain